MGPIIEPMSSTKLRQRVEHHKLKRRHRKRFKRWDREERARQNSEIKNDR